MDFELDLSAVTLETPRLILRPWRQEDLDDFYAYAGVPGVGESAGWPHHTDRQTTQRVLDMFIEEKNVFAVQYKADGRVIGSFVGKCSPAVRCAAAKGDRLCAEQGILGPGPDDRGRTGGHSLAV